MSHAHCSCCSAHAHGHTHDHHHHHGAAPGGWRAWAAPAASLLLLLAGLVPGWAGAAFFAAGWVRLLWYVAAFLPVGWPVAREAFGAMRHGDVFNEFTLMLLASVGAFYIGEYPEAVAVMLFYAVGERFQDRAVARARRGIRALVEMKPATVAVWRGGGRCTVAPEDVRPGEVVEVPAGGRLPVPMQGLLRVRACPRPFLTVQAHAIHGVHVSAPGRLPEVFQFSGVQPGRLLRAVPQKGLHGLPVPGFHSLVVPVLGLFCVRFHAGAGLIAPAQTVHGGSVPRLGGGNVFLCKGIMSRKKQLLPLLLEQLADVLGVR